MKPVCITIDIDWAHDAVINETLDLLDKYEIKATIFVTHATPTLGRMREAGHELGLHPNFNPLLEGAGTSAEEIFDKVHEIVPEAESVRSHSLVRSTKLSKLFAEKGMRYESNVLVYSNAGHLVPWIDPFGLLQVPIRWEDDIALLDRGHGEPSDHLVGNDVHVCDFHPIHIFLNSLEIDDYEDTRPIHQDPTLLRSKCRPTGQGGSRDRLIQLIERCDAEQFTTINRLALDEFSP